MSSTVLQTKLFVPPARSSLVARPRLIEKLTQANSPGFRAVVLSAPAGFGKTTLITQWIETMQWPVSWLSLDENDNTAVRFFRYLIAVIQKIVPTAGQSAQDLIGASRLDVEEIINSLSNELAGVSFPFVIALDDYHTIHESMVHQAVRMLLDALPPQARLILLSREDPPLPVARLRARGQIIEIRANELRFSGEEAAHFLNQVMGLSLSGAQIHALEARTEGWIVGLQLAALSMQNIEDRSGFIQAFSGSNRFILDYLVEEVLDRQSQEIQAFLTLTSILDRFNAELCRAVVGETLHPISDYQDLLSRVERSNLFLISLDNEACWFRYHHLFADLLRARLKLTHPEILPDLHRRASRWFEDNGDPKAALDHAIAGREFEHAADLIDQYMVMRWREIDVDFLMAVNLLPPEVLQARPSLCLHSAWMYVVTSQTNRVLSLVEAAERRLPRVQDMPSSALTNAERGMLSFAKILRAYLEDFANRTPQLDFDEADAIEAVPQENTGMRNSIAVVMGMIHYMEGDFAIARSYFRDAIERDKQTNGTNAVPVATARWGRMLIVQGKLHEAVSVCRENEAYVRERGARRFYVAGNLNILWGEVLREWNLLDAAEQSIREGLRLHDAWPIPQAMLMGLSALGKVQISQGRLNAAEETLMRGLEITRHNQIYPEFAFSFQAFAVCLWSAQDNKPRLESWLQENERDATLPFIFRHEVQHISRARALLAVGRHEEGLEVLRRLSGIVEVQGRNGHAIEIFVLMASYLPTDSAYFYLKKALCLAAPEGYLRTFLDPATLLIEKLISLRLLLETRPDEEKTLAYLKTVLAAHTESQSLTGLEMPTDDTAPVSHLDLIDNNALIEPVSRRELEVLHLVAQGLASQQIADRLVISIRTVKKHLQNVYGKLGVDNRLQAVTRARELHLL